MDKPVFAKYGAGRRALQTQAEGNQAHCQGTHNRVPNSVTLFSHLIRTSI